MKPFAGAFWHRARPGVQFEEIDLPDPPPRSAVRLYAGTDHQLHQVTPDGQRVRVTNITGFVIKNTIESVTSTTLQDDDELFVPIAANEVWVAHFILHTDGALAGDIQVAVGVPTGATGRASASGLGTNATNYDNASMGNYSMALNAAVGVGFGTLGAGSPTLVTVDASVKNGANAGTIVLRWAQLASNATPTRVLDGSCVTAWRVN